MGKTGRMNCAIVAVLLSNDGRDLEQATLAESCARKAIELEPTMNNAEKVHASSWAALAMHAGKHAKPPRLEDQREFSENAVACYDRILALSPKDAFALHFRGARLENRKHTSNGAVACDLWAHLDELLVFTVKRYRCGRVFAVVCKKSVHVVCPCSHACFL